jgi:HEAT repeat protein
VSADRQLDLFSGAGFTPDRAEPEIGGRARLDPSALSDAALIQALAGASALDAPALAAEAGRRRLVAAVPALAALCRRFKGFGRDATVAEQIASLAALARIGGREAADMVGQVIAEDVVQGPGLPDAVAAAAAPGSRLPVEVVLACLRHPNPAVRADACRLAAPSAAAVAVLIDLLDDLHDSVSAVAACALGRMGRDEASPRLIRMLANTPSPEAIDAFARIADDDGVILLGRLANSHPDLAGAVLAALDETDLPRAAVVAAGVRRRLG